MLKIQLVSNMLLYLQLLVLFRIALCEEVKVTIPQGVLEGAVEQTFFKEQKYFAFKGVPYAVPPVGDLRFMPPQPHQGWEDTYQAVSNKPTCFLFNGRMRNGETFGPSGSEDCLYLSIFTPDLKGNAPVVVFDYNDNFKIGFNGTDTYSPEFFVEEGVMVVFISHRLGLFGYLTTEDDVIPANAGLKDFILGLEWIKANIEHFGGNPNQVTLMGNSGGAALANILLYSKKATGLFSAVILQSGTALEPVYFFENPSSKAYELAALQEIEGTNSRVFLEELQKVDAEVLVRSEVQLINTEEATKSRINTQPFAPSVEKDNPNAVLTFLPENGVIINDVPVIIGLTSREGLDLISMFIFQPKLLDDVWESFQTSFRIPIRVNFTFDKTSDVYKTAAKEINNFYYSDGILSVSKLLEYAVKVGDEVQNYAIDYTAKWLSGKLKSPVYYYIFDFRGSLNENSEYLMKYTRFPLERGATITDELCYLHLCSRIKTNYEKLMKLISEQAEVKVLKKMVRMWTNFAKTRNPTPEKDDLLKNLIWEPMDKGNPEAKFLHITKTPKMKTNPLGDRSEFWDKLLEKYGSIAVDGVVVDNVDKHHTEL